MKRINVCFLHNSKFYKMLFVIHLMSILLPIISLNIQASDALYRGQKQVFKKGELKIIEGIPFLKLTGTNYEMGEQYGNLLKNQLKKLISINQKPLSLELPPSYKDLEKRLPTQVEFLKGVAKGSSISYHHLFRVATFDILLNTEGCSSILKKTIDTDGKVSLSHCKNQDMTINNPPIVIQFNPTGKYKYLIFTHIGRDMVYQGINEKGISVSSNAGPLKLNNTLKLGTTDIQRDVLETCSLLQEADELMKNYTANIGVIFTVGSAFEEDGFIYDIAYDRQVKHCLDGKDYLFVTNYFLSDELTSPAVRNSCERYQIIRKYTGSGKVNTIDEIINVLSDTGASYGVNNKNTAHSVIFNGRKLEIYFAYGSGFAASGKWLKYNWKDDVVTVYKKPVK